MTIQQVATKICYGATTRPAGISVGRWNAMVKMATRYMNGV